MAVFHLTKSTIEELNETSFECEGLLERHDLQRLLKTNISIVAPDVLIIAEEFCDWQDSKRRIDLLGVDRKGNLVVIELKRDSEGGHMDLQALRYAAMVSMMTFDDAVEQLQYQLEQAGEQTDARSQMLEFLGWSEPREEDFASETRIVLVAADFGREITTTVLWLNECSLDIRCVRMKPYALDSHVVVDVQQIVPLPEAQEYQIGLRKKSIVKRESIRQSGEPTGYWFMNIGDAGTANRSWDDRKKYGFMTAGGGKQWIDAIKKLRPGNQLFAYATGSGYVGLGRVLTEAVPFGEFRIGDGSQRLVDLPLKTPPKPKQIEDPTMCDWCVGVEWLAAVDRDQGALRTRSYRGTLCQIRQKSVVDELLKHFRISAIGADPK